MTRMIQVLLCYAVEDIFEDYTSNRTKTGMAYTTPFFCKVGLRKFVLVGELLLLRPYFVCHLTAKRPAKILGSLFNLSLEVGGQNLKFKV